jgi:hypothetical protein
MENVKEVKTRFGDEQEKRKSRSQKLNALEIKIIVRTRLSPFLKSNSRGRSNEKQMTLNK